MIYTYGCSFTKWRWPTWSDWLENYTNKKVTNFAWPGNSNQTILYQILSTNITEHDTVYIMLSANNRTGQWYDPEFIENQKLQDQLPAVVLPIANTPNFGYYRHTTNWTPSLTEMYISNWHTIYQIQTVLDRTGCNYKMMFWQNPWHDVRPVLKPKWQLTWFDKGSNLSKKEITLAKNVLDIPSIKRLLTLIDWTKFNIKVDIDDPSSFTGLWNYQTERVDLLEYQHPVDRHPSPILHHDFLVDHILDIEPDLAIRNKALDQSKSSLLMIGEYPDFNSLLPPKNDYTRKLIKPTDVIDKKYLPKKHVLWTIGGSGGIAFAWMIQLCYTPDLIDVALQPLTGQKNIVQNHKSDLWTMFEVLPPDIGYLPNALWEESPNDTDKIKQRATNVVTEILSGSKNVYQLLRARLKYTCINHVWHKGWCTQTELDNMWNNDLLADDILVENLSNEIFDKDKIFFLSAPPEYLSAARSTKWSSKHAKITWTLADIVPDKELVYSISSVWNGTLYTELERITGKPLSTEAKNAIATYRDAWYNSQPDAVKEYINNE